MQYMIFQYGSELVLIQRIYFILEGNKKNLQVLYPSLLEAE